MYLLLITGLEEDETWKALTDHVFEAAAEEDDGFRGWGALHRVDDIQTVEHHNEYGSYRPVCNPLPGVRQFALNSNYLHPSDVTAYLDTIKWADPDNCICLMQYHDETRLIVWQPGQSSGT